RVVFCLVILACIAAASTARAADQYPFLALADPEPAFRAPGSDVQAGAASGSNFPSAPARSTEVFGAESGQGVRSLDRTWFGSNQPPSIQVAQAATTTGPGQAPTSGSSWLSQPLIFGATLYLWVPFATSTSTISSLPDPTLDTGFHTSSSLTNLYGGAGDFQLTKGDWGLFANLAGGSLGFKGVLVREDPLHRTESERTAYSHYGTFGAQYGLSYRLFGQPLDLSTWARGKQPIAFDLLAGAQTFYTSVSVKTAREQTLVSAALTSPVVGARVSLDLADRWNLGVSGNVGGFGVSDTSLTWQANVTVSYRFLIVKLPAAVSLGFRAQGLNLDTETRDNRLQLHEILYGPLLGFSMYF
ncbi:MAG TPA: hypothetical protein VN203_21740, partial [Candidatus Acidoferrum sp.]|nr:hypothetical protein [Candidatus Acidoferrum sp.]